MRSAGAPLKRGDWVRYQLIESKIVLEGFIQEITPDGLRLLLGNAPDTPDGQWYDATALRIIQHQPRH